MGGSGTRNPVTGLPEFFLKKLFKNIFKIGKKIAPAVVATFNPALGAALAAADAGIKDGKLDFKKAALAGIKTLAFAKAGQAISGAGGAEGAAGTFGPTNPYGAAGVRSTTSAGLGAGASSYVPATVTSAPQATSEIVSEAGRAAATSAPSIGQQLSQPFTDPKGFGREFVDTSKALGKGIMDAGGKALGGDFSGLKGTAVPLTVAGLAQTTEMGIEEAEDVRNKQKAIFAARRKKEQEYSDLARELRKRYPFQYNKGGVSSLPPRYLDGMGDGMSDSIKANIGGMQEARLADGEFVVPADVVADLGNGSSNAGAERLYSMMDRIRQARHGTTKQPPEVNVNKTLPA